jgi:hypothetical protein
VKSQEHFVIKFFEETPPQPSPNQRFGEGVRKRGENRSNYYFFK